MEVLGKQLGRVDMRELRERIGFVDPNIARNLRPSYTAREIVLTGAFGSLILLPRRLTQEHSAQAMAMLGAVGAAELAERRFEECSPVRTSHVMSCRRVVRRASFSDHRHTVTSRARTAKGCGDAQVWTLTVGAGM
jgi:iron complex transport system ATP-binding protein